MKRLQFFWFTMKALRLKVTTISFISAGVLLLQVVTSAQPATRVGFSAVDVAASLTFAELEAGNITAKEAWERGALTLDSVAERLKVHGLYTDDKKIAFRNILFEIIRLYGQSRWLPNTEAREGLQDDIYNADLRIAIADYLSQKGDSRAEAAYKAILREFAEAQAQGNRPPENRAVIHLVEHYLGRCEWAKARDAAFEGFKHVTSTRRRNILCAYGARACYRLGDIENSSKFLSAMKTQADPFMRGMALYEEGLALLGAGKPVETRDTILRGLPDLEVGDARLGAWWVLAKAQWKLEAWPEAEEALRQTLDSYASSPVHQVTNSDVIVTDAQNRLAILEEWKKKVPQVPLKTLNAVQDKSGVFHARLYIHSWLKPEPKVTFSDAGLEFKGLTLHSQSRPDLSPFISVYNLAYRVVNHPSQLKARVEIDDNPLAAQSIILRCFEDARLEP